MTIFETKYPKPKYPEFATQFSQYNREKLIWDYRRQGALWILRWVANNLELKTNKDNDKICEEISKLENK